MRPSLSLAVALLAAVPTLAHADTVTQSSTTSFAVTSAGSPNSSSYAFATFNPFNTSLGTLTSVNAFLSGTGVFTGSVTNHNDGTQSASVNTTATYTLGGSPSTLTNAFAGSVASQSAFQGFTLPGNASASFTASPNPATATESVTFTNASDLLAFESGAFSPMLNALFSANVAGPLNVDLLDSGSANLSVTYTYTPSVTSVTPEPSSIVLLGSGLLSAAAMARRRFARRA